ncbi:hypothetical protein GCM10011613_18890 [Cellvibrio zantedeschiae]|uniref:MobA-like NTP transferase domain-containing protein n=1 Tax=Cellvibrio zantedeschiae TaxID=1237077 RepID=A0ABQ3B1Q7_9GAMM|nr:nucleotidyltransferase family protein [Cellvibrio zantedeschiae]GGY73823.1 hypothetical protein GCM10011613_18890 [Cellvibrio zantedeschiae]
MKLDCLVLAAGSASRFGSCKLLADWKGQPLISATLDAASALKFDRIKIVSGAYYPQLLQAQLTLKSINPHIELLEYRDWHLGMGHSLAFGIEHFPAENAVLILLGDQPLISGQDLQNLYNTWRENPEQITCASFANTFGVPAIFPPQFKTWLRACTGDRGAKVVLANHIQGLKLVPMPAAEFDVDTPVALQELLKVAV